MRFVVIGHPIAHSLSPAMHSAAIAALGLAARPAQNVNPSQSASPTHAHMRTSDESGRASGGGRRNTPTGRAPSGRTKRANVGRAEARYRSRCGTWWRLRTSGLAVVPLETKTASAGPQARAACRKADVGTGGTSPQRATPAGVTPRRSQKAR